MVAPFRGQAQEPGKNEALLFAYFKGNGDGLHLAASTDGLNWSPLKNDSLFLKPQVSQDKLLRDPCIIKGPDNLFHMVWTVSWNAKGIGYANSLDLIHWSEQQYIPVMEHEAGARNSWAPEITYDKKQKVYLIYWATTITGLYPETQSKEENSYNHRMYYTTTADFKKFSPTKLLYEPGFNVIDATIVPNQSQYLMFLKDETREPPQKNIRIATSKNLVGPYMAAGPPITGKYWAEGPTALKLGINWIVYFDKYTEGKMGAVTSPDLKKWTDISGKINFPAGVRHGTVFKVTRQELEKLK
ncbi:glycosyl hydrolase [Adhaeribacter arboris]|uniref:Glycosyl hydrolase n=1 Tax=Adhaeribacter arboris TaxID=2072846 RepID=A0A2T2YP67_9BACT|nr:glycosyl hydrolase [Adhaeribacter arboris]